ncbi:hypothetical protein [Chthoniobacter flavus]|uniref:hypothetical protein n=1 Tax=Chthoniobacter flavus TaxID=191863 RepID=UPI0012F9A97F|nr:hypothetical protein [Chthoniobacter flavus]
MDYSDAIPLDLDTALQMIRALIGKWKAEYKSLSPGLPVELRLPIGPINAPHVIIDGVFVNGDETEALEEKVRAYYAPIIQIRRKSLRRYIQSRRSHMTNNEALPRRSGS